MWDQNPSFFRVQHKQLEMAAAKPISTEAVALTEKKMDMALDDIIKMSKTPPPKNNKQQRVPNKGHNVFNGGGKQQNFNKAQRYLDSRSSLRQGFIAQRRSTFQGNRFPVATQAAKKAAAAPLRNRLSMSNNGVNRNPNRVRASPFQRMGTGGRFAGKPQQGKFVPKHKPNTMDALFASMKEQRMKKFPGQNSTQRSGRAAQQTRQNQFGGNWSS